MFFEDDSTLDILSNFFTGDNVGGGRRRREDNTTYANTNNANSIQNNKLWNDDERRNVVITTKPYARRSSLISRASSQQSFDKEKVSPIHFSNWMHRCDLCAHLLNTLLQFPLEFTSFGVHLNTHIQKFDTILKTNGYSVHWTIVGMGIHVYENNVHHYPPASSSRLLPHRQP